MTELTYLHATRVAYDTVAESYAKLVPPTFENDLYGRAMIGTFAELARALDAGPVADLGCGPGHVTAHRTDPLLDTPAQPWSTARVGDSCCGVPTY